jgi:hypothetical protein
VEGSDRSLILTYYFGRAMAHAVRRWPLIAEARVHARVSTRRICSGQNDSRAGFFKNVRLFLSITFHRRSPYSGDE